MKLSHIIAHKKTRLSKEPTSCKLKKKACKAQVRALIEETQGLQDRFYAEGQKSVLIIFQAMDAAGKDGAIKHVMSGLNPQGCIVKSFKQPSAEELSHDFLWRVQNALPGKGMIGIFNRSYYEETLIVRVHPEILAKQKLAPTKTIWEDRFEDIKAFEAHLARCGTKIIKIFLHVSKAEQKKRFLARIDDPAKNWKFSSADLRERAFWDDYQHAYEETLRHTSTKENPWFVIPADNKWAARLLIAQIVTKTLRDINPQYPNLSPELKAGLAASKLELIGTKKPS